MPTYTIKCRITLEGADMIVEAASADEALRKANANEWDDIEYDCASLSDWTITGKPKD